VLDISNRICGSKLLNFMLRCFRLEEALEEISQRCTVLSVEERQWQAALKALTANDASQIIVEACLKHDVTPNELLGEMCQFTFDY
jgi:hypothetical protein